MEPRRLPDGRDGTEVRGGKTTLQSLQLFGLMDVFGGAGPASYFTMAPLR